MGKRELKIRYNYPDNPDFKFTTQMERINLDEERKIDLLSNNGFIVSPTNGIKKDLKDENSIFSMRFGNNLSDMNQFGIRFRCKCGKKKGSVNKGVYCKDCDSTVQFVDDNPKYTGWLVIKSDKYFLIHPNLFKSIEFFIGKNFINILNINLLFDEDGKENNIVKENEPFYGIGMIEFKNRFDEIMNYYMSLSKNYNKRDYYEDIMANRDKIFIQSVPVFSTILRPFNEDKDSFYFEESNAIYTKINKLITELNNTSTKYASKKIKPKEQALYDVQMAYMKLYDNIICILEGKKGAIRSLFAGRYNFTARDVIIGNPELRIDQIKLSYYALVELEQLSIINIIKKTYNLSYQDAYNIWYNSKIEVNPVVVKILNSIINHGKGIPILINRNPTIQYGSILQMFCIGISFSYTMEIPLPILPLLCADFDGDVLNSLFLINKDFIEAAYYIFNPRNSMYISRNDGKFNNEVNHQRDTIINLNTFIDLGRGVYTKEDLDIIMRVKK